MNGVFMRRIEIGGAKRTGVLFLLELRSHARECPVAVICKPAQTVIRGVKQAWTHSVLDFQSADCKARGSFKTPSL